jgi:hypothetical protein
MDDAVLRDRYRRLTEARQGGPPESSVPLALIEALAEDRLEGAERIEALDRILADPGARSEYEFLREIAAARPRPAMRGRRWLIAAAILVAVGGGLVWRAASPGGPEPLRGPGASVVLIGPADGGTIVSGGRLVWRPVAGAIDYVVEVLTPDGAVAFRSETPDTSVVLVVGAGSSMAPGPALWVVTARLGGSAERRSPPRHIVIGR